MRFAALAAIFVFSIAGYAQEAAKPAITITVDEIMEKAIAATGGKEATLKMTSMVATGSMEIVAMGASAAAEMYAKAPNKRASYITIDGYGEVKNGYDGKIGWSSEPQNGLVDLAGEQLATAKRDAEFNGQLKWKELYPKSEVKGKEKFEGHDCWVVKLTPTDGKPATRYYDAETFLLTKVVATTSNPQQGEFEIEVVFSDYKDMGNGVKSPYTTKITLPGIGDLITKYKEIKTNVDIDDAKFAKPKN